MHCDNDKRQSTSETRVRRKTFRERRSNQCWAFNKAIEYNLHAFLCIAKTFYQSKKKKKRKQTVETVWVFRKRKKKESRRHRQCCPQKVWNAFPHKQYVCGEESFQGEVPLLVGCGIGKEKKIKVGAFRARVNAHVKLAALRLHNSVASKNNTAVPATRSCRAQLEWHSKDNSARGKKSRSRLVSIIYACAALSH